MKTENMLFIVLFGVSLLLVSNLEVITRADIKRDCRQQTNVSWASLKRLKAGNVEENDINLKCYLRCFMMKSGILSENNNVDIEKAVRHLPRSIQESSREILNRCKSIPTENVCDKAFQIAKCYVKAQPEILKSVSFV